MNLSKLVRHFYKAYNLSLKLLKKIVALFVQITVSGDEIVTLTEAGSMSYIYNLCFTYWYFLIRSVAVQVTVVVPQGKSVGAYLQFAIVATYQFLGCWWCKVICCCTISISVK
jgi:hypothetical protein